MDTCLYFHNESDMLSYVAAYDDFVQDKIYQENELINKINTLLVLKETTTLHEKSEKLTAMYEAKISDTVKAKWKAFVDFIKQLFPKFMESMTKLFTSNKTYLDKYKDTILNKKPKNNIDIEIPGDYSEGIKRMVNTTIPIFSYSSHSDKLKSEGDKDITELLLGSNFKYKDGEPLATQLKNYFLGIDKGTQKKKLSDFNMKDMYNFCYNVSDIKAQYNKDIAHLDASTNSIQGVINRELQQQNEAVMMMIKEAEDNNNSSNDAGKDDGASPNSGVKITTNNPVTASKSYDDYGDKDHSQEGKDAKDADENIKSIDDMIKKWITVCKLIITAKMTAQQQIAKNYMKMIRAHVQSYVGKKDSESDKRTDEEKETEYEDKEKAKQEKEKQDNNKDNKK